MGRQSLATVKKNDANRGNEHSSFRRKPDTMAVPQLPHAYPMDFAIRDFSSSLESSTTVIVRQRYLKLLKISNWSPKKTSAPNVLQS